MDFDGVKGKYVGIHPHKLKYFLKRGNSPTLPFYKGKYVGNTPQSSNIFKEGGIPQPFSFLRGSKVTFLFMNGF
jgi:hypothetical protein